MARTAGASQQASPPPWRLSTLPLALLQAGGAGATQVVAALSDGTHPAVVLTNPNTCYMLFLRYGANAPAFHAADGRCADREKRGESGACIVCLH